MRGRKRCLLSRCLAALLAAVLMIGIVGYVPEAKAWASASSKITIFSQTGSNSAVSTLKLGDGSTKMSWSGCGIYSLMHAIQWCTNNGSGKKLTMDEGVALAKEMIAVDKYPWNGTPYSKYGKVLSAHGVKTVSEPSDEAALKAHFDKGGAVFLHQYNWGKSSGHYVIAVGYVMHDIDSNGNPDFLIQIVDSAVDSSASRYKYADMKAYRMDSYALLGDGWAGGGQYWISYNNYKKHNMRAGFLPNGNSYGGSSETQDYTVVDNNVRIAVSTKPASGEDQCYIKEKPLEDSKDKSASVPKGNTIKLVGAVENKYGNIWYKTEDGGFVYSGDVIFYQDYFTISAKFKNTEKRASRKLPFVDSDAVQSIGKDEIVQITGIVKNSYGNLWAKLTDGSYLCFYDKETGENKLQFSSHVTKPTHSTTYPQGDIKVTSSYGFLFKGDVKAEVPFLSLTARVIDRETEKDVSATGSPCTLKPAVSTRTINLENTKIDGKTMDSIVLVRKLNGSSGWYRYELNAQFGFTYEGKTFKFGNEYNFVSSDFTVGNPGTLVTKPTPEVKGNLTIGSATKNGDVLEIPVGIQGNPGLVGIGIKVDLPEDFWNFNVSPVDIGKDAIPYTEGVNGGDTVALMSMGTMTGDGNLFKIHVSTAGIDLAEFTLKVTCVSAGDANGKDVMFTGAEKTIQLSSNRTPGDANDDGAVDWADVILALKYTMKLNVSINLENAEVTADGIVDWSDVILLLKYVMKLNVQLQ